MTSLKLHKNKHNTKGGVNNGGTFFRKMLDPPYKYHLTPCKFSKILSPYQLSFCPLKIIETFAIFLGNIDTLKILLGTVQ